MRVIHGIEVNGSTVDDQTRCTHYNSPLDIIAIKFKCCDRWFPCRECHDQAGSHEAELWPRSDFENEAILCGACGHELSIDEYMSCGNKCLDCGGEFNPGCENHYHLYFDLA